MNELQRSATELARRARNEAEIWNSDYVLFVIALTVSVGIASWGFWGAIQ